jgi:hypothetical protein
MPFFLRSPGCNEIIPPAPCGKGLPGCPGGTICSNATAAAASQATPMDDSD